MNNLTEKVPCVECGEPVSVIRARNSNGLCFSCVLKHEEKVACAEWLYAILVKWILRHAAFRNMLCDGVGACWLEPY